MTILPCPDPEDPGPDPVDAARRAWLTRRLVAGCCRRYLRALEFCREVDEAMPVTFRPPYDHPIGPALEPEARAWWYLLAEAEADFYLAESGLADRLNHLYDLVAPEGRRVGPLVVGEPWVERGVTVDGTTFVLTADPADHQPGVEVIAIVRADRTIALD